MNIDSKQKIYSNVWQNDDEQLNDSNFQEEGDYIMNKMPKYKYEIKVIHPSPTRANRSKKINTPDRISPSIRFTIINKQKTNKMKNQNNIYINKYNNENFYNQLPMDKSPRTCPTFRFYSGNSYIPIYNRNSSFNKSIKYIKKHKRYNNKKIKNFQNYTNNYEFNNNECNCHYIIEIFPANSCICQKEINKIINEYFKNGKIHKYNNNCNCGYEYENGIEINNNKKIYIYNKNIPKKENNYFFNMGSPQRKKSFKKPIQIEKTINNIYYPKKAHTPINKNTSNNNNSNNKKIPRSNINNYNNNIYYQTSNISSPKQSKKLKKITIKNNQNIHNNTASNNSFISADNRKNLSPHNNSFINQKKYNRKNYLSPYYLKSQSLSNNLNNTTRSNGRKSNNILINKSSERKERIKVVPIGQKIDPLIVKKSVEKPIKEKIVNDDGTTTNVIRQTSVITSIESKPFVNKENNQNLVKESITKIYTTLTKNEIENENNNEIIDNNVQLNINDEIEKEQKKNYKDKDKDKENNNIQIKINDENKNINNIPNNENQNIINNNDILGINNDLLIHKNNNNSSFNYSSLYSNINELSEQYNNINRINEISKYIKYLYYRCTNLTSLEQAKEESLSNYFLKLNYDEKIGVLHYLNDSNVENKKIYDKLLNILEENNDGMISDDEFEKNNKNKKNILIKKIPIK